ncbi:hypothetical protein KMW28_20730 [Flammeovirga yaeyamensis]|uniref:Purine-cytosine permease n=1 Tax=Flammeovirga yaeyamensis TaxID=367791 RepID=A0AAX1NEL9_9BACT|nr:hypothetical protein [Flammeovirga yaeyamensis]MBB3697229.1 purine-cytosine permease-like protein [Flammeovirga yaeyamensis]NMF33888.1 hypothetical protein [Flammeovirga yaeyamensis]QWG04852.1 hypothetical protein KMW28_20730 [Flammeovirga yaeyamensis]
MQLKKLFKEQVNNVNEYEREPVPKSEVKGFKSFVGMVSGEHIAGTEFVIGPLFVLHGAAAKDVFLGLLLGNLLATLSWVLFCAPAAVKTRTTIFYQLERISGKGIVTLYNSVNGLLFCVTASAMIGVSASAVGIMLDIKGPGLNDLYPTSPLWVGIIFAIGAVITIVATFGFDKVSKFANIFAPWMPVIFFSAGVAMLPQLGVTSVSDFFQVAEEKIWTGVPIDGQTKYTFWHIMIFAWLCNSAMHLGLADMSIYRYAKKSTYGLASAFGMFIGHFMAWIASGILCAVALQMGETNPSPGQIAFMGAGVTGLICVVIAGWTTANPTIYRSGLAVQGLFPKMKRWKITLIVGCVTTILACSPAFVAKLDQFLGVYALCAAPIGAIVLADIFIFPKLGLQSNYAEKKKSMLNLSVLISWALSVLGSYLVYKVFDLDFYFFAAIPGWLLGFVTYIISSKLLQRDTGNEEDVEFQNITVDEFN